MLKLFEMMLGKGKKKSAVEIKEGRLKAFLIEEKEEREDEFILKAKEYDSKIKEIIADTEELLAGLESAELYNKKVTAQEMNFMTGNRKAYIKNTRDFLERIGKGCISDRRDSALDVLSNSKKQLDILSRNNRRPYMVMQHFFANESRVIAGKIKEISGIYSRAEKDAAGLMIDNIDELIRITEEKEDKEISIKNLKAEKEIKQGQIKDNSSSLKKAYGQLKKLEVGPDYAGYKKIVQEKEMVSAEIKHTESEFISAFDQIDSAIKKYSRIALEDGIVNRIIKSPIEAVENDKHGVFSVLQKMHHAVSGDTIELKDKKKDRMLVAIAKLDERFFEQFITAHSALKKRKQEIEDRLQKNSIMRDYEELSYRIKHLESRAGILNFELDIIEKKIDKTRPIQIDDIFIAKLKDLLKDDVKITA